MEAFGGVLGNRQQGNIAYRTICRTDYRLSTASPVPQVDSVSTNLSKRVIARSKVILLDSGLAARLINISAAGAGYDANPTVAGQLIESFAVAEIRRQLGWAEQSPLLHHHREQSGAEIDTVLETADGRVAALESRPRPPYAPTTSAGCPRFEADSETDSRPVSSSIPGRTPSRSATASPRCRSTSCGQPSQRG